MPAGPGVIPSRVDSATTFGGQIAAKFASCLSARSCRISRRTVLGADARACWSDVPRYAAGGSEGGGIMSNEDVVFIVDDDGRIREALSELLESHGMRAMAFGSAGEYMDAQKPDLPACLVLDVELPDINGLELQGQIADGDHPPIVFITGHGSIPSSVRAIKRGAVDFLTKPFSDTELLQAVRSAIARDRETLGARAELGVLRQRYLDLTPREREVLPLVVSGLLNKQAAAELGISEVTLQIHRRKVMQKMQAGSLAELVRFAQKLQIPAPGSRQLGGA
jgi:FixJ family two-component response regulator